MSDHLDARERAESSSEDESPFVFSGPPPSDTDPLTRLPNRTGLRDAYALRCTTATEEEEPLALALFDLGGLEEINELRGCIEGDRFLRWFATRLARSLPEATVGRWGGDEFVALFPNVEREGALGEVRSVLEDFRGTLFRTLVGAEIPLSFSVGIASVRADDPPRLKEAIREAARDLTRADRLLGSERS